MWRRLLPLASIVVAVAVFAGGVAWAANGDGPAGTATQLSSQQVCQLVGGPLLGKDAWAFAAPPGVPLEGVIARFTDADGVAHRDSLTSGPAADLAGRRVGWLVTPAGWRFTGAWVAAGASVGPWPGDDAPSSAVPGAAVAADEPVLIGACAGSALEPGRPTPATAGDPPTTPATAPGQPSTPAAAGQPRIQVGAGGPSGIPAVAAAPDRVAPDEAPTLAATGQDIGSMFVVGWALVVTGGLLLIVRRRRRAPRRVAAVDEPGLVWLNPPPHDHRAGSWNQTVL